MTQEPDAQRARWFKEERDEALARFGSEAVAAAERAYAIWLDEGLKGDDTLSAAVIAAHITREACRAGQAAAEARVKELEEVIRSIESQLRNYAQMPVADWAMPTAISGPPGWMMIRDILGSIVEYERSHLEEDDDCTTSGPVDPDTQFLCEVYAERRRRDEERVRDMLTNLKAKPNGGDGVLQLRRT